MYIYIYTYILFLIRALQGVFLYILLGVLKQRVVGEAQPVAWLKS